MSPLDSLSLPGSPHGHRSNDDDPFTSIPSTPSSSHHQSSALPSVLDPQATPQHRHQTGAIHQPSIDSLPALSPHVPGWYPSTPGSSAVVVIPQYSDRSDRSSIMTCSLDDGFLTANQTPVSGSFLHHTQSRVALSAGSHTSSSSEEPTGPIIDHRNLQQNLLILSPSARHSASSSPRTSRTSHSFACSASSKMVHAEDMGSISGNHSINATSAASPGDLGSQPNQVIEASDLPAHSYTKSLPSACDGSAASSEAPSADAFAYRTIGPAFVLRTYQPKKSSVDSISTTSTTPENSPKDFDKLVLPPPYSCCSDSIYPESSLVGPDTIDLADIKPAMPRLEVDQRLPESNTEQPSIPAELGADSTLLDSDEIVDSYTSAPAHNSILTIDEVEAVSSGEPESVESPALQPPAIGLQGTEVSAPNPGTEVSVPNSQETQSSLPDILPNSTEGASHSQPVHPPEFDRNSPAEVATSVGITTLPPTLPQVDVIGCSLMEGSDDLIRFDNGDGSDEKRPGDDLPKLTPAGEQSITFSELSSNDTLNEPVASGEPVVVQAEGNQTILSTDASEKNLVGSARPSTNDSPAEACANDSPAEATPQVDAEVTTENNIAPVSRQTSVREPCVPQLSRDLEADQPPVPTTELPNAANALNSNEPVASANNIPQEFTPDNKVAATVPEEFLIVAGLNPEQVPSSNHPASDSTPVANDVKSSKPLNPSQATNDPANPPQTGVSNLPTVSFPSTRPVEEKHTAWSLNPTNRLSSSTEIVDPLLRSNILNESVRDTNLAAVDESQTEQIKASASARSKRTLRARSISGFFKLNSKKDLAKTELAHSPTSHSIHSSEEETRSFGKKVLPKRKSLSMLKRKSGFSWISRNVDEPVPPLPNNLPEPVPTNDQAKSKPASQDDEKLNIVESVESNNLKNEHSNPALIHTPGKQESNSEQSLLADATSPTTAEGKTNKSPRQFKVSLAKRYFRSESARVEATSGLGENLEGPFSSVIGGIGYSPSAPRPKTLRKKRTMSTHVASTPVLKDIRFSGLISKLLGRKSHADEIVQGA
ncbi:hypothetical protein PTTG_04147 [Puccinia triticina 1-1 BBBD Race 1]|uniref:Uncharacterized protein n=1 Tax=Puccinia triticina (isolate 1-1 / race 1 (BBBD)) TaxID=630390 RepID=A0A180GG33_PUCT1|nr:hypothetical protein PTTG_04147 [Puccinia triticina 1-1 BBBD Race 1]